MYQNTLETIFNNLLRFLEGTNVETNCSYLSRMQEHYQEPVQQSVCIPSN